MDSPVGTVALAERPEKFGPLAFRDVVQINSALGDQTDVAAAQDCIRPGG